MTQMQQAFAGSGQLSDETGIARAVHFNFEFVWEITAGAGGMPVPGKVRTRGKSVVTADDGQPIGEGTYQLVGSDGKRVRVQRLGMQWHLLSPFPC